MYLLAINRKVNLFIPLNISDLSVHAFITLCPKNINANLIYIRKNDHLTFREKVAIICNHQKEAPRIGTRILLTKIPLHLNISSLQRLSTFHHSSPKFLMTIQCWMFFLYERCSQHQQLLLNVKLKTAPCP